jgi:hypothetical protein
LTPVFWELTLTTTSPHFRIPGQNVVLDGVRKQTTGQPSPIIGAHKVTDVLSPTVLRFAITADLQNDFNVASASAGISMQAISTDGGTNAIAERNRIFGARIGGPYHDTWDSKDLIVQKNYYYGVMGGLFQNMGNINTAFPGTSPRYADSLTRGGPAGKTATLTASFRHGLVAGQVVNVTFARIGGVPSPIFNGYFIIEKVLTPKSFTYRMSADPGADADITPPEDRPVFGALWQTRRITYHKNILELVQSVVPVTVPNALGMGGGPAPNPQYLFNELVARRNLIRTADGLSDPNCHGFGAHWLENGIVQRNIMAGLTASPISYSDVLNLHHFNNQTQSGQLVQGLLFSPDFSISTSLNQLETELDLSIWSLTAAN